MTTEIYEPYRCFDGECFPASKFSCPTCPLYPASNGDVFLQGIRKKMNYPKMKVFFVINGTTPVKAFRRNGINRFLMSAFSIKHQQGGGPGTIAMLSGAEWILDSGMISAWRTGMKDWMNEQPYVAELARKLAPTFVSHLDIPVEKHLLSKNRMTRRMAIQKTITNARDFMDAKVGLSQKIYVLQGWDIDEFLYCLAQYRELGILHECRKGSARLGVGSVCLRKPGQGLFGIAEKLRKETEGVGLHLFGVGQIEYQKKLDRIGIDSTDTGSVLMQWAFSERHLNSSKTSNGQTNLGGMT